jgi:transposase
MKRLATTERGGRAESEWVARCLEELGHEEVVGDPNFHLMHATRNRNVKPDRHDARTLAEACRNGTYRPRTAPRKCNGTCARNWRCAMR